MMKRPLQRADRPKHHNTRKRDLPPPDPKDALYVLTLTASQRMALMDIVLAIMTGPMRLEAFVDVVRRVETTPEQLLQLLTESRPVKTA